ncbi:MAG: CpsD/CapB family tyrosine-protein kinase [Arenibacterium sp.]
MDRLQQAINKARAARDGKEQSRSRRSHSQGETSGRKERLDRPTPRVATDVDGRWAEFNPLELNPKDIRRNRLVAHTPGEAAIPFDMLRTKILQMARKNDWKRIAIVSPESGSGKTTVAANLGLSFSRMRDKRTIIFDFDLRRVGLARVLGQKCSHSMSSVLERRIPFSNHGLCYDGNVAYGLNRERVLNPSELLQNPVTHEVLNEIEDLYEPDLMFFDTPPLMVSDDSQGFLESVDCALLIVAAEKTPMDRIDVAERQLSELTNVLGIVLNRCRYTSGAHGYENEYY